MLEVNFYRNSQNILTFRIEEGENKSPTKISGDDSWFDYGFKPLHNGSPVSLEEGSEEWTVAIADSYQSQAGMEVTVNKVSDLSGASSQPKPQPPVPGMVPGMVFAADTPGMFQGKVLSDWWARAGALILDWLITLGLMLAPIILFVLLALTGSGAMIGLGWLFLIVCGIGIPIVYFGKTMSRPGVNNGQSWGKQVLDITVVREDGQPVTFGFAFVRQVVVIGWLFGGIGSWLVIPYFLNYLWPLWDDKNQALHDKIVKSRVVKTEV